jgi:hypothetical protein
MWLVEARRERRGNRPADLARFVVSAGSRHAALARLRARFDTSCVDLLSVEPIDAVVPIAGALVHEMVRRGRRAGQPPEAAEDDDAEPWRA